MSLRAGGYRIGDDVGATCAANEEEVAVGTPSTACIYCIRNGPSLHLGGSRVHGTFIVMLVAPPIVGQIQLGPTWKLPNWSELAAPLQL
jgi:hypothetical protein